MHDIHKLFEECNDDAGMSGRSFPQMMRSLQRSLPLLPMEEVLMPARITQTTGNKRKNRKKVTVTVDRKAYFFPVRAVMVQMLLCPTNVHKLCFRDPNFDVTRPIENFTQTPFARQPKLFTTHVPYRRDNTEFKCGDIVTLSDHRIARIESIETVASGDTALHPRFWTTMRARATLFSAARSSGPLLDANTSAAFRLDPALRYPNCALLETGPVIEVDCTAISHHTAIANSAATCTRAQYWVVGKLAPASNRVEPYQPLQTLFTVRAHNPNHPELFWRICADAFEANSTRRKSWTAVYLQDLNHSYSDLFHLETIRLICLAPGGVPLSRIMGHIINQFRAIHNTELQMALANNGLRAPTTLPCTNFLALIASDTPCGAKFAGHGGMASHRMCRRCNVSKAVAAVELDAKASEELAADGSDAHASEGDAVTSGDEEPSDAKAERAGADAAAAARYRSIAAAAAAAAAAAQPVTDAHNQPIRYVSSEWSRSHEGVTSLLALLRQHDKEPPGFRSKAGLEKYATDLRTGFPGVFSGVLNTVTQLPVDPDHLFSGLTSTLLGYIRNQMTSEQRELWQLRIKCVKLPDSWYFALCAVLRCAVAHMLFLVCA